MAIIVLAIAVHVVAVAVIKLVKKEERNTQSSFDYMIIVNSILMTVRGSRGP